MTRALKLDGIELTNFRKFEHFTIDFDDGLTVLVGNNASGKSAILDAACIALSSFTEYICHGSQRSIAQADARVCQFDMGGITDQQAQYPVSVSATGRIDDDAEHQINWAHSLKSLDDSSPAVESNELAQYARSCLKQIQSGDEDLTLPVIAYYGAGRFYAGAKKTLSSNGAFFNRQEGYRGAFSANADCTQMLEWFYKMTAQDVQRAKSLNPQPESALFAAVRGAVERCYKAISGCKRVNVTYNLDVNDIDVEAEDANGNVQRLPLGQLSDGYRTMLSLFTDIAYRMALLNPASGKDVLETPGIVLIDEVDLHLHPLWQVRVLQDLRTVFPNVQFIVTSHAPLVISSVPRSQIRILGEEEASVPMRESRGLSANDILTGLMGAGDRQPDIAELLEKFNACFDREDFSGAEHILDELENKTDPNNPDVVAARSALFFERL